VRIVGERPAIVHLIGFPGAGKFTIATAMARRNGRDASRRLVVVDNHLTSTPIFSVLDVDGVRELPAGVWDHVDGIRDVLYRTIETLSPSGWSFVMTNVLVAGEPDGPRVVQRLTDLAAARGSVYVPVRLLCGRDELLRRVQRPDRQERQKWVDADAVDAFVAGREVYVPDHGPRLDLDVTSLAAAEAADTILHHVARITA
jgi:hypothetical protein